MNKRYEFFCGGPFSQWHQCNFTIRDIPFISMKQYTMYEKAMLFDDHETAQLILQASDPKIQKALGRKIKNFDISHWNNNASQIVFRGSNGKYTQNKRLYDMLINTYPAQLVEATPYDSLWGIGIDEKTAVRTPDYQWPGKNWLGIILTDLRDFLMEEETYDEN